ncbi:hypothetical protein, partial [Empedobacter stercoris]|uniref:hypothetical protein n=1 Tax=Empedobacter stercoris TaxID=1628248 RepID=UPI001CE0FB4B
MWNWKILAVKYYKKFNLDLTPPFCQHHVLVAQLKNKKKFGSCCMQGRKEFTPQLFYELSLERLVPPDN